MRPWRYVIVVGAGALGLALPFAASADRAGSALHADAMAHIGAGQAFSCVVTSSRAVRCWGDGESGRLGTGSAADLGDDPGEPESGVDVPLGAEVLEIALADVTACARLADTRVRCWGNGSSGKLGNGSDSALGDAPGEIDVATNVVSFGAGRTATALTGGQVHSCARLDNGEVRCWGNGGSGRLGNGTSTDHGGTGDPAVADPGNLVDFGGGRTATAVSAGDDHTCAILDTAQVRCWGNGVDGQNGNGNNQNIGETEGDVAASSNVALGAGRTAVALAGGRSFSCAILDTGQVRCWGEGDAGRLGNGATADVGNGVLPVDGATNIVDLGAGRTATAIVAGVAHACALMDDGRVKCWGESDLGRLGNLATQDIGDQAGEVAANAPVNFGPGRTVTALSAGQNHTCAVLDTGAVRCWGEGAQGALGIGTTTDIGDDESPVFSVGLPAPPPATTTVTETVTVTVTEQVTTTVSVPVTTTVTVPGPRVEVPVAPNRATSTACRSAKSREAAAKRALTRANRAVRRAKGLRKKQAARRAAAKAKAALALRRERRLGACGR